MKLILYQVLKIRAFKSLKWVWPCTSKAFLDYFSLVRVLVLSYNNAQVQILLEGQWDEILRMYAQFKSTIIFGGFVGDVILQPEFAV